MVFMVPVYRSAVWDQAHSWNTSDEHLSSAGLGMRVKFTAPGQIVGLRYLRHPADTGLHIGLVCPDDGGRPISWSTPKPPLDVDAPAASEWHTIYLHPRVRIAVGTQYECGVWFEQAIYGYEPLGTAVDIVAGPITVPADDPGGRRNGIYFYGGPSQGFGFGYSHLYAVDVVFLPD